MKFGRIPVTEAQGLILAHSLRQGELRFKKGRQLSAEDLRALEAAGIDTVVGALLAPEELGEDIAAERIAAAVHGAGVGCSAPFTGRCNLYAESPGLLLYERERLDALNLVNEAITIATLPPFEVVAPQQMIATIKIIPYGVAETAVEQIEAHAGRGQPLLRVAAFQPTRVGLLQTQLPGTPEQMLNKTRRTLEQRLARLGSSLVRELRCRHEQAAIAEALAELRAAGCRLLLIAGASATADRRDVVPSGIVAAGGEVVHMGMPVEPGNLLLLGRFDEAHPVICLPGCARSPVFNGFDWVLERLLAGVPVTGRDIMLMGAGGLIKGRTRVDSRRAAADRGGLVVEHELPRAPRIAAVILAAGESKRMGPVNKLLEPVDGQAMVVRVVEQVLASKAAPVVAVLGHEADKLRACLASYELTLIENTEYALGMSTSLSAGISALPEDVDGVLVCLGDMPWIHSADIDRLIAAFSPADGRGICIATHRGRRGNPVLLARRFFEEMDQATGDIGARELFERHAGMVCEVEIPNPGVLRDIDLPENLPERASAGS